MTSRFPPFVLCFIFSLHIIKRTLHVGSKIWIFMFSWQEQYLTRSLRSLLRYCSCHSNIKFISSRHRVISSIYLVWKTLIYCRIKTSPVDSYCHLRHLNMFSDHNNLELDLRPGSDAVLLMSRIRRIQWIKFMWSKASESIRNGWYNLDQLSRSSRLAQLGITAVDRLWFRRRTSQSRIKCINWRPEYAQKCKLCVSVS